MSRIWSDVAELKLPDCCRQLGVAVGSRLCRRSVTCLVTAIAQRGVTHAQPSLIGNQVAAFDPGYGFAVEQIIQEGTEVGSCYTITQKNA